MDKVIELINSLKNSPVRKIINQRMNDFEALGKKNSQEIFKELCFCLLTANFNAHGGIKIQKEIGDGFLHLPREELAKKLAEFGHRFPNARAKFIFEARRFKDNIKEQLSAFDTEEQMRIWLIENVKGLGMKEASHFLRNIGYKDIAIIDFHIIDFLVKHNLISFQKKGSLSIKKYIGVENVLREIAEKTGLSLGELDLYLWYSETGKVLK